MLNKNEEILLSVIAGFLLICFVVIIFILSKVKHQKKTLEYAKERDQLQFQFSQAFLQTQIEIQEQTLRNIGSELHDNLAQVASLIKINLNTLNLSNSEKAKEKVEDTLDLTRQLIADIKSLSVSLASGRLEQTGLVKAIENDVERITRTNQFTTSYQLNGILPDIGKDKTIILYRMVQEVLDNIVRHSKAKQINILLNVTKNLFTLVFIDNGLGFNADEIIKNGGSGLHHLQNRGRLINAQLSIQSTPGNGTHITIALPL